MGKPGFFVKEIEKYFQEGASGDPLDNGAFCILPWIHFHVTQHGTVAPCCVAPWDKESSFGNINETAIEKIWNSQAIKEFRLKMLRGEADYRCKRCHVLEKGGALSPRQSFNKLYYQEHKERIKATAEDGALPEYKPVYLDVRFSNKCNFKCRICGPHSSSAWYEDAKALGERVEGNAITRSVSDPSDFFTQLNPWLSELEEVYFAGGEPLFLDEHYELLDELIASGNNEVLLRYSTNFSSLDYEKGKAIDYWKKFKKVMVVASLDDMGERAELHRKGQNWKKTEQNIRRFNKELPHAYLMISSTISIWNIFSICDFHRYMYENGFIEADDLFPNLLEQPEYYSIKVLPQEVKQKLSEKLKNQAKWVKAQDTSLALMKDWVASEYIKIADFMMSEDKSSLLPRLKKEIIKLDKIRKEHTLQIIPELKDVLNGIDDD